MTQDVRWEQRMRNFEKALNLLLEINNSKITALSALEKEGFVQRFEYTLELAWKTLKDKMEYDGLTLDVVSPKMVIKTAFQNKYIDDSKIWLEMIDERNLMSHTYDNVKLEEFISNLQNTYSSVLNTLLISLKKTDG